MTYHIRWQVEGMKRIIHTGFFANAKWLADALHFAGIVHWQLWAENENACWVIASSKSREERERWRAQT